MPTKTKPAADPFHPYAKHPFAKMTAAQLTAGGCADQSTRAQYVSDRLFHACLVAYLKAHCGNDDIGWSQMSDILHSAICEAMGDDQFCKWSDYANPT